ncbi:Gfo/Idh/MocA family protein [Microbacterium sp. Marseille-Q6965]|uniref:Gfo/Idh/MocA family oxidoreductase n=1 Tax=Microbacterium sp. Marseille-Q6965 TaxID=2965072 RepID=UPI0021B7FBCD|nr:Gfo/Idh/MocA family oxidoreductase [Microbacterium sp. Marseille-Q6965]
MPAHIAVIGAGLIGRQHIARLLAHERVDRVTVIDPVLASGAAVPPELEGAHLGDPERVYAEADGVIIATPNVLHTDVALRAVAAGTPALVEKPLADTEEEALRIIEAADRAGVPILVGHHRRYSGVLRTARQIVESGELGPLVAVTGSALFSKPASYFEEAPWRREEGGGPLLINLVHDVDAMRYLAGEVVRVRCVASSQARGFEVEDTAALTLEFASGALGTFILSDAASSFRSWEQTSGENPSYDRAEDEDCYHLAGRLGSLSVPTLRRSRAVGEASWWRQAERDVVPFAAVDPLTEQLNHFLDVVDGAAAPLVTARDGLQSLRLVLAARRSAAAGGAPITVPAPPALTASTAP